MKNLIIASTSTLYGSTYLDYLLPEIQALYKNIDEVVFMPIKQAHDFFLNCQLTAQQRSIVQKVMTEIIWLHILACPII